MPILKSGVGSPFSSKQPPRQEGGASAERMARTGQTLECVRSLQGRSSEIHEAFTVPWALRHMTPE
jgi:hypothetical protein